MLSSLILLIPKLRLRIQSFRLPFIALGSTWIPRLLCGGLRRSDRIFSGGGPTSGSSLSARSGGYLPSCLVVRFFQCRLGSHLKPFWGSEWTLNLSVFSAASVKVVGVTRPVRIHAFSLLLALFFLFSTIPMLLGQRFFSNHGMGGRRMLFLP